MLNQTNRAAIGRSGPHRAASLRQRCSTDHAHRRPRPPRRGTVLQGAPANGYLGPAPRVRARAHYAIEEAGGIVCPPYWSAPDDAPEEFELEAERRKLRVTSILSACAVVFACVAMRTLAWALGA
ncbi:MAG: hypothetical protein KBA64_03595 [Armatimonadetes bacterium]|nr:hypothetical protein [Armatimonadota bacterium]MDI9601894.1 hypothetical protein [Acidobacteriota bacterium]NLN89099.1 hypothetical protein [candidate division WS1 bacterium]